MSLLVSLQDLAMYTAFSYSKKFNVLSAHLKSEPLLPFFSHFLSVELTGGALFSDTCLVLQQRPERVALHHLETL